MAHLWMREHGTREWSQEALRSDTHDPVRAPAACCASPIGALVHTVGEAWVLIASEDVAVNGRPLLGGMRVLRDRDEIRAGTRQAFFSTEEIPHVVPFSGAERPVSCARCQQPIASGDASVRCPGCGVWHHQSSELPCWTYTDRCAVCDQPTSLDADYCWSPEML